ncbi:MAG TPA: 16S rRNA processing protein RimM [Calditrichaeota bacterium]|nr:16S rRNA processing protein RimM [Calditrichota bacterium]
MYLVGKVLKPQGIKGEVKAQVITSIPEHFTELKQLYINEDDRWQALLVESVRLTGRFVYIKFAGIHSRNEAEKLRDRELFIEQNDLLPLENDAFYIHDLIGLNVENESGQRLGTITDVESYPANDVYVVSSAGGDEYLIPAIIDVVLHVDLQTRKMVIREMEGLLDRRSLK